MRTRDRIAVVRSWFDPHLRAIAKDAELQRRAATVAADLESGRRSGSGDIDEVLEKEKARRDSEDYR